MAILKQWKGDDLTPGITVTTATAGTGDDTWAEVIGTAPTIDASGPRTPRMKFDQGAGVPSYVTMNFTSDTACAIRWYARYTAVPVNSFTICEGRNAGGTVFRVDLAGSGGSPPGELRLRNSANVVVDDSGTLGVPLDQEIRVELLLDTDVLDAFIYNGDNLVEQFSVSGTVAAGANIDRIRIGNVLSATTAPTFYVDDFRVDDVAVKIGPASAPGFPTWHQWDGAVENDLTVEGVYDGMTVNPLTFGQVA